MDLLLNFLKQKHVNLSKKYFKLILNKNLEMNVGNKKISIVLKSTLLGNGLQNEQSVKQVNEEKIPINRIEVKII